MVSWEERANLLGSESQKFHQYLSELPDEAWTKQSACDLWRCHNPPPINNSTKSI